MCPKQGTKEPGKGKSGRVRRASRTLFKGSKWVYAGAASGMSAREPLFPQKQTAATKTP